MAAGVVVFQTVGNEVARMCGLSGEMDDAADKVLRAAKALAARHNVTGVYMSSFGTDRIPGKRGVVDREVYNDASYAVPLEDGHLQRTADGVRFVGGLHILRRAAKLAR